MQFSRLLGVTVGLLVLIGSSTVGMLVLVRTEARRDEFAICAALGAPASRLARGVAIEGGLLAVAGDFRTMGIQTRVDGTSQRTIARTGNWKLYSAVP